MGRTKKQYSPEFKLKVVLEILKGEKTATQLAGDFGVHPVALSDWKKQFLENGPLIFTKPRKAKGSIETREQSELFEQIGRLKMENEWLKKNWGF